MSRPCICWSIDDADRVDRDILSKNQLKVFLLVHEHLNEHRKSLTSIEFGKLMDPLGMCSYPQITSKTWYMLCALEKKGYLKRLPYKKLVFVNIGLHLDVHRRLKKLSKSYEETYNVVIRKALDALDSHTEKENA